MMEGRLMVSLQKTVEPLGRHIHLKKKESPFPRLHILYNKRSVRNNLIVRRLLYIHIIGGFMDDLIPPLDAAVFQKGVAEDELWPFLHRHLKRDEEVNRAKPVIHLRRPCRLHLHFLKTAQEFCGDIGFRE